MRNFVNRTTVWVADESGPMIWGLIVRFRWFIAIIVLAAIFFNDGEEILLGWFDLNLELIRHLRVIPEVGPKLELFFRFINGERIMVIAEVTLPILLLGWTRRRLRVRVSRDRRSNWDRRFWHACHRKLHPGRELAEAS